MKLTVEVMSGGSVLVHWAGTRAGYIHLSDWSGEVLGMRTHQDGCPPTRTNPESRVRVIDTTLLAPEAQEAQEAPGSEEIRQHESMMEPLWRRYCEEEGGLRRHSRLDSDDDDY